VAVNNEEDFFVHVYGLISKLVVLCGAASWAVSDICMCCVFLFILFVARGRYCVSIRRGCEFVVWLLHAISFSLLFSFS